MKQKDEGKKKRSKNNIRGSEFHNAVFVLLGSFLFTQVCATFLIHECHHVLCFSFNHACMSCQPHITAKPCLMRDLASLAPVSVSVAVPGSVIVIVSAFVVEVAIVPDPRAGAIRWYYCCWSY